MLIDKAELKRRYLLRIAGVRDNKVYIGPKDVALGLNNICNLSCKYCYSNHAPGNPRHLDKARFFAWERFLGIVRDCVDLKVDQIILSGSGEPTLHPLFPDMMRHLEDQPVYVRLLTNGTFPLDYCSQVIKGDRVVINLSACDRQQYRDLHGKDLFGRVVNNIKRLVSLRDALKPCFRIEIGCVINVTNIDQKQKMQDLALQLGIGSVFFKKMHIRPYYDRAIILPGAIEGDGKRTFCPCLNGWFQMIVGPDDVTSLCCQVPPIRQGNSHQWSLKKIWLSKQMMNMRVSGKTGHMQKKYKDCQTCQSDYKNSKRLKDFIGFRKNEKAIA